MSRFFNRRQSNSDIAPALKAELLSLLADLRALDVNIGNHTIADEFEAWTFQASPDIGIQHLVDDLHDHGASISRDLADKITRLAEELGIDGGPCWRQLDGLVDQEQG